MLVFSVMRERGSLEIYYNYRRGMQSILLGNIGKHRYRYRGRTLSLFGLSRPGTGPDITGPGYDTVSAGRLNWHFSVLTYIAGPKVFMDARRPVTP